MFNDCVVKLYDLRHKCQDNAEMVFAIDEILQSLLIGMAIATDALSELMYNKNTKH